MATEFNTTEFTTTEPMTFASDASAREEFQKIADLIWRLRPLAEMAVHAELARAMEKAVTRFLAERMETILTHLEEHRK